MTTVTDLTTTTYSGLNYIDALLDDGPDWNYMTPAGNTITYTFSTTSGNESGKSGQVAFTAAQQACTRTAIDYLAKLTGIQFVETTVGTSAQIHFADIDILGDPLVTGLCSWTTPYSYNPSTNVVVSFEPQAWVYLDNNEWWGQNEDLTPGGAGYETLLHELGHALGLKHPFETTKGGNLNVLPDNQDNPANTLMSYTPSAKNYSTFSQYDVAALNWLYGGDGLRGALGMNSTGGGRYVTGTSGNDVLTGTSANDTLKGEGGNDKLDGGAGLDTAVFAGARANYTVAKEALGFGVTDNAGNGGHDLLLNVERVQFADGALAFDIDGTAGVLYRLYRAVFDRAPDLAGLGYWIKVLDQGASTRDVMAAFIDSREFVELYGANTTTADYVTHLYANVLHRAPDRAGYDYWVDVLDNQHQPRDLVLASFSESKENQLQVIGSIQDGIAYTPWVG